MTKPVRIRLSRSAGFSLATTSRLLNGLKAVKCDRTTRWGNPYRVGQPVDLRAVRRWGWEFSPQGKLVVCKDVADAVNRFGYCLAKDEALHPFIVDTLGGRNLACWCGPDQPCHVDPILRIANP